MEAEELMILRDLPVDTRNYTIVDNITGKPIDQSTYTLTIDTEVIGKLNKLKQVNEEKIRQAALRDQYGNDTLVSTFTPDDNAVFTPVYNDEYIDYHDFNKGKEEEKEVVDMLDAQTFKNLVELRNALTDKGIDVSSITNVKAAEALAEKNGYNYTVDKNA